MRTWILQRKFSISVAAILAATIAVYWASLQNGFVRYDDHVVLFENPVVMHFNWQAIFFRDILHQVDYIPLTLFSLSLENHLLGLDPFHFHLINLLMHLVDTVLLIVLLRRLFPAKKWVALAAGALFALHPLHVESVAWVTERKDVQYVLFFLSSLLCYLGFIEPSASKSRWKTAATYSGALLFFVLSLLTKSMAVTLPAVLFLCDYVRGRGWSWRLVLEKVPFFVLSAAMAFVRISTYAYMKGRSFQETGEVHGLRVLVETLSFYLSRLVIPHGLSVNYNVHVENLGAFDYVVAALVVVALVATFLRLRSDRKLLVFSLGWFLITLAPVLRFYRYSDTFNYADRYSYLPSVGLFLALGLGAATLFRGRRMAWAATAAAMLVLGTYGWLSFNQCDAWQDTTSLWTHALAQYPDDTLALQELAQIRYHAHDLKGAIELSSRAVELDPRNVQAMNNLAVEYRESGRLRDAAKLYQRMLDAQPTLTGARIDLSEVLLQIGSLEEARTQLTQVTRENPKYPGAHFDLGTIALVQNRLVDAEKEFKELLAIDPGVPEAYRRLEFIAAKTGRKAEAKEWHERHELALNAAKARASRSR